MTVEHYENFPVASVLCPPALRPAVRAIYWFARTADDLADEGDAPPAERLAALRAYRSDLLALARGALPSPRWAPVFSALAGPLRAHDLPLPSLLALLDAFEEDVQHTGYEERDQLLAYCRRSAVPIGRLLLHLHGVHDPRQVARSDAVCTALQLVNFWQDLSVDRPRGRDYVPRAEARAHGTTSAQALSDPHAPASRALVCSLCAWAEDLLRQGAPIALAVPGRVGWELRLVVQGAGRILEKIAAMNYASYAERPRLRGLDPLRLGLRALAMRRPATPRPPAA